MAGHDHDSIINRERVATRVTVRTVKKGETRPGMFREDMSAEKFSWLNRTACSELTIGHFFVEAGHAISEDVLNVCRGCPVRMECLEHAELLGDGKRGVVGQHHPARAEPDALGGLCEVSDQHRR